MNQEERLKELFSAIEKESRVCIPTRNTKSICYSYRSFTVTPSTIRS